MMDGYRVSAGWWVQDGPGWQGEDGGSKIAHTGWWVQVESRMVVTGQVQDCRGRMVGPVMAGRGWWVQGESRKVGAGRVQDGSRGRDRMDGGYRSSPGWWVQDISRIEGVGWWVQDGRYRMVGAGRGQDCGHVTGPGWQG
eukprot:TRINITY_DN9933_c0_g1_i1.p3 TRINITY_DN9933_c0_g1~~TRINITY_DN9933_c0_g1_i1.p3  ORF type:complete len:140 (+),score=0.59 TRINITY_DN9933_c0_g1_i1:681-1100(+)